MQNRIKGNRKGNRKSNESDYSDFKGIPVIRIMTGTPLNETFHGKINLDVKIENSFNFEIKMIHFKISQKTQKWLFKLISGL